MIVNLFLKFFPVFHLFVCVCVRYLMYSRELAPGINNPGEFWEILFWMEPTKSSSGQSMLGSLTCPTSTAGFMLKAASTKMSVLRSCSKRKYTVEKRIYSLLLFTAIGCLSLVFPPAGSSWLSRTARQARQCLCLLDAEGEHKYCSLPYEPRSDSPLQPPNRPLHTHSTQRAPPSPSPSPCESGSLWEEKSAVKRKGPFPHSGLIASCAVGPGARGGTHPMAAVSLPFFSKRRCGQSCNGSTAGPGKRPSVSGPDPPAGSHWNWSRCV